MQKQTRLVIQNVKPQLDGGQYYIKRIVNQWVKVSAEVLADGHDILAAVINYKHEKDKKWTSIRANFHSEEYVEASFQVTQQGIYQYHVEAWVDYALNWQHGTIRKINDNQHVTSELLEGAEYCKAILKQADKANKEFLQNTIKTLQNPDTYEQAVELTKSRELYDIFYKYPTKTLANQSDDLQVYVDRPKALFSTWYEFFPRSASPEKGKHGTFKDCERLLPRIADMGFDVLYFPPIHPIGEVNRKGKNNTTVAETSDVGSPWAIGSSSFGGHRQIHPELGTAKDFKQLVKKANDLGIEIAMDFALQAAPDHPYVKEHKQWFKWRPDGTVQYAENPPKKYQDIQPFYFETDDWKNLWQELLDVMLYWIEDIGVHIFRVDNPHTKPFYFWGWLISEIKKKHPDVLFLAEAFTRPKIMHELAKQGFTQSYTYFTWRNTKHELTAYVEEMTKTGQNEFFRPNFWPNTPDILPPHLQTPTEAVYMIKYFLAATLSSNTGVYGPVYEYMVYEAMPGKEEYLHSEKYEIRHWNWNIQNKLTNTISQINQIRKENTALQQTNNIVFCGADNEQIMAFYKYSDDKTSQMLMVCNLDGYNKQQAMVRLPIEHIGNRTVKLSDLITGQVYWWHNEWNFVELHPHLPFHLFKMEF